MGIVCLPLFLCRDVEHFDVGKNYVYNNTTYFVFYWQGWIIGQFGPSFLDLQVITHTRLEEGSAFMTSHSVGYLFGSLISGILFDKFNKLVLLFFTIAGNGITVVVIPWCVLYEMMIAIHTVKGLFSGGLDACMYKCYDKLIFYFYLFVYFLTYLFLWNWLIDCKWFFCFSFFPFCFSFGVIQKVIFRKKYLKNLLNPLESFSSGQEIHVYKSSLRHVKLFSW